MLYFCRLGECATGLFQKAIIALLGWAKPRDLPGSRCPLQKDQYGDRNLANLANLANLNNNLNSNLNNQDSWDGWSVWTASSPNSTDLMRMDPSPSYCKLICYEGKLQSIHLIGDGADELIVPLAAMIGKPVSAIAHLIKELAADDLMDLVAAAAKKGRAIAMAARPMATRLGRKLV